MNWHIGVLPVLRAFEDVHAHLRNSIQSEPEIGVHHIIPRVVQSPFHPNLLSIS